MSQSTSNKNLKISLLVGLGILVVLIAINTLITLISVEAQWIAFLKKGLLIINVIVISWIALRLAKLLVWDFLFYNSQKKPPEKLKGLINFIILLIASLYIITHIFELPVWSVTALGGLVGAGFALALQGVILDFCSGVILDIEKPFLIGDWIEIPKEALGRSENIVAKVIKKKWRTTIVSTLDKRYIIIPNSFMTKASVINLNRPEESFVERLLVKLDHTISVERAERLLLSAALAVPEISKHPCSALAFNVNTGGIEYTVLYTVEKYESWRKIRHKLISSITKTLHGYNLQIFESVGNLGIYQIEPKKDISTSFTQLAHSVDIFSPLSMSEIEELSSKIETVTHKEGEIIVRQGEAGDSMFIVAEGAVEVYNESSKKGPTEKDVLAHLGPGQCFGDMALLLGENRSAFVKAMTSVLLYNISKAALAPILEKRPEIVEKLSEIVSIRRLQTQEIIASKEKTEKETSEKIVKKVLEEIYGYFEIKNSRD